MTEPLVACVVADCYTIPADGRTFGPGDRVLVPASLARRWAARGALRPVDDEDTGEETAP